MRRATLQFLPALIAGAGLVIGPPIAEAMAAVIGIDPLSTDLMIALALAAIVTGVHHLIRRLDTETVRQTHAMRGVFRRYVPDAVAAQLENGRNLEPMEREVSVLFVDIRGYTTLSQACDAADLFSAINCYTEMVARIIQRHGGCVTEFHGDGAMAVFGAPDALPRKAQAALEAGQAILAAIGSVAVPLRTPRDSLPVSVGIGIATGTAFVGNLHAADRLIWTAIGNTSNLAARLQGLTRDLGAAIIIDRVTWAAAGQPAAFERHGNLTIRGRRDPEDVYVLPLPVRLEA